MADSTSDNSSPEISELRCDICGAYQSAIGKGFTQPAQVWLHKIKQHWEAVNQPAVQDSHPPSIIHK